MPEHNYIEDQRNEHGLILPRPEPYMATDTGSGAQLGDSDCISSLIRVPCELKH